jgi:hypothetical protein
MSTDTQMQPDPPKRSRGRPRKTPEEKVTSNIYEYQKSYREAHKDDEHFKEIKRKGNNAKQKRAMNLYTLIKKLIKLNYIHCFPEEKRDRIMELTKTKKKAAQDSESDSDEN